MVRTAETAKISSGRPKKTTSGSTGDISQSSSNSDRGGGNPICPRETPSWQKPITNFFHKVVKEKVVDTTKDGKEETGGSGGDVEFVNGGPQLTVETMEEPTSSTSAKPHCVEEMEVEENTPNSNEKENMINTINEAEIEENNHDNLPDKTKKRKMNYESFEQYENTTKDSTQPVKKHKSSKTPK